MTLSVSSRHNTGSIRDDSTILLPLLPFPRPNNPSPLVLVDNENAKSDSDSSLMVPSPGRFSKELTSPIPSSIL
jgi:hypothetical protein